MIETINGIICMSENSLEYATEREIRDLKEISRNIFFRMKAESSDTDAGRFEKIVVDDMKATDPALPYLKEINEAIESGAFEFALSDVIVNKLVKAATGKNSITEIKPEEWERAFEMIAAYGFYIGVKRERKAAAEKARVLL